MAEATPLEWNRVQYRNGSVTYEARRPIGGWYFARPTEDGRFTVEYQGPLFANADAELGSFATLEEAQAAAARHSVEVF